MKTKESMPIQVNFKPNLRTDGEFCMIKISQLYNEIVLTEEQAISLLKLLHAKYKDKLND